MNNPQDVSAVAKGSNERTGAHTCSGVVILALAELPASAFIDEKALADALRVSKRTIRRMVSRHELPPGVAFGGRAMWQVRGVLAWFENRAERAARDAERTARKLDSMK